MGHVVWDREAAAHLLGRAGFSGPPAEVEELLELGLEGAVDRLVAFDGVDNSALEAWLASLDLDLGNLGGITAEWIARMVHTARPFEERMALLWHTHFGTGIHKVLVPELMRRQVGTFREAGRGTLDDLLLAVSRDPAMLIWLDNIYNHAAAPNENYARELMELYSMGIGTYTQEDVLAAARAFTGWTLYRDGDSVQFVFVPWDHDGGEKTFLGETGPWDGTDVVRIICEQEVTPRFIARRLWLHLAGGEPDADAVEAMASAYWSSGHSLEAMFRTLFTHPAFYAPGQRRARVKSPPELVCGLLRQLEGRTSGERLGGFLAAQGMALFDAPDPSGWDEGMAWVTTSSLLLRSQLASALPLADTERLAVNLPALLAEAGVTGTEAAVDHLADRLRLPPPGPERREALAAYLVTAPGGGELPFDLASDATRIKLAGLVHVLVTDPAYQLA